MSSPVHVTIQSVRLSWRIAGSDGSKSAIGLKDGGGFGITKNSTPPNRAINTFSQIQAHLPGAKPKSPARTYRAAERFLLSAVKQFGEKTHKGDKFKGV